jgi:hypothetical protein
VTPAPSQEFRIGALVSATGHPEEFDFESAKRTLGPWLPRQGSARRFDAGSSDGVNAPQAGGPKRKATDELEDDQERMNKPKTNYSMAKTPAGAGVKPAGKKARYSNLEGVEDAPLPDFSQTLLSFSNRDASLASFQTGLRSIEDAFVPVDEDETVPQDDAQRRAVVRIVLGAIRDTTHAKDANSSGFQSRWIPKAPKGYSDSDMEGTAWEIVVSKLHLFHATQLTIAAPRRTSPSRRPFCPLDSRP